MNDKNPLDDINFLLGITNFAHASNSSTPLHTTQHTTQHPTTHSPDSPRLDAISQFLKSSSVDFSFDSLNIGSLSSCSNRGVTDEISQYLREKSGTTADQGKPQVAGDFDYKSDSPMSSPESNPTTPKCDQKVPPNSLGTLSEEELGRKQQTQIQSTQQKNVQHNTLQQQQQRTTLPNFPTQQQANTQPKRKASLHGENNVMISKHKKRQEKNREAAQLFRQRQKAKVAELEKKMETLINVSNDYRQGIDALFNENRMLNEQLIYWKTIVASGILISQAPPTPTNLGGGTCAGGPPGTVGSAAIGYGGVPADRQTLFEELKKVTENLVAQK